LQTFKGFDSDLYRVNDQNFNELALSLFYFQAKHNPVYSSFLEALGVNPRSVKELVDIPFLPISFFKNHRVRTGDWPVDTVFTSSGTTGITTSTHEVANLNFYLEHAERTFEYFFGKLTDYHFLALLPSYLERKNSSLVAMMDHFIKRSQSPYSGFFLKETDKLIDDLNTLRSDSRKTILWGVTFALLDLAEGNDLDLSHCLVFETGGMKGRRKEIIRSQLHAQLRKEFNIPAVYSEYGMTELLSQAYTHGQSTFSCPPWLKILGREVTDPMRKGLLSEVSGVNVVDLANWHSVAFIETEDLGKVYEDGTFEILGRFDNSDLRGCNLLGE
jgi:phenylacetate-coenzyme A ligase PaaK-like adenylate-forming protein